jgi:hypothetical protein
VTDKHAGSSSSRTGTNPYVERRVAAYLKRREDECGSILARAYIDVWRKLNRDVRKTFLLFDEFTKNVAKPPLPPRRRGKADPDLDARILAAGDAAPRGQKEEAILLRPAPRASRRSRQPASDTTDWRKSGTHTKSGWPT